MSAPFHHTLFCFVFFKRKIHIVTRPERLSHWIKQFECLTLNIEDLTPLLGTLIEIGILPPSSINCPRLDSTDNSLIEGRSFNPFTAPPSILPADPTDVPMKNEDPESLPFY